MPDPLKDETELLRDLVAKAQWNLLWHEHALLRDHELIAFTRALIARCAPDLDVRAIEKDHKEGNAADEDDDPSSADDFFRKELLRALSGPQYHEDELRKAHKTFACLQALILRGKYEIDLDEIRQAQIKKLEERK